MSILLKYFLNEADDKDLTDKEDSTDVDKEEKDTTDDSDKNDQKDQKDVKKDEEDSIEDLPDDTEEEPSDVDVGVSDEEHTPEDLEAAPDHNIENEESPEEKVAKINKKKVLVGDLDKSRMSFKTVSRTIQDVLLRKTTDQKSIMLLNELSNKVNFCISRIDQIIEGQEAMIMDPIQLAALSKIFTSDLKIITGILRTIYDDYLEQTNSKKK